MSRNENTINFRLVIFLDYNYRRNNKIIYGYFMLIK